MRRTDLQDTDLEVHRMRVKLLREKTPEWRILKALELSERSRVYFPEQTKRVVRRSMRVK